MILFKESASGPGPEYTDSYHRDGSNGFADQAPNLKQAGRPRLSETSDTEILCLESFREWLISHVMSSKFTLCHSMCQNFLLKASTPRVYRHSSTFAFYHRSAAAPMWAWTRHIEPSQQRGPLFRSHKNCQAEIDTETTKREQAELELFTPHRAAPADPGKNSVAFWSSVPAT